MNANILFRPRQIPGLLFFLLIGFLACSGCSQDAKSRLGDDSASQGVKLLSNDKLPDAMTAFDEALQCKPDHLQAIYYRAVALQQLGKDKEAIAGYSRAISLYMDNRSSPTKQKPGFDLEEAYRNRGTLYNHIGETDKALDDFTEALRWLPSDALAYTGRGIAFIKKNFPELAQEDLTAALRLDPNSEEALCYRGRTRVMLGSQKQGIGDCLLAIRHNPKCALAYRILGTAYISLPTPDFESATKFYREAKALDKAFESEIDAELAEAYFNRATKLNLNGQSKEAEIALAEAIALDKKYTFLPSNPQKRTTAKPIIAIQPEVLEANKKAYDLVIKRDFDEAIKVCSTALAMDPKCSESYLWRGVAFLEKGSPDTAVEDFDQSLYYTPHFAKVYIYRAKAYTMLKNYLRAIQDATEAIRINPDDAEAYINRGNAYLEDKNFDRALADFANAILIDPKLTDELKPLQAQGYYERGRVRLREQKWDEAIADSDSASALRPPYANKICPLAAQAYRSRGQEKASRYEFKEALSDLNTAIDKNPENALNYQARGKAYYTMSNWQMVIADLNEAIQRDPEMEYELRRFLTVAKRKIKDASAQNAQAKQ
jgi:tetratricopeptide (TPR) repeat protein